MNLPWNRPKQADHKRGVVLANLTRLQDLFRARGRRFDFDASLPTNKLEDALWYVIEVTGQDRSLTFPAGMACEARISEIARSLEPLARPGAGQASQWPGWLQQAR